MQKVFVFRTHLWKNASKELFRQHTLFGQEVPVDILHAVRMKVVLKHIVVTHAESLCHHVVDILALVNGLLYADADQTAQQQ